jgi:hypothetical protein
MWQSSTNPARNAPSDKSPEKGLFVNLVDAVIEAEIRSLNGMCRLR